MHSMLGIAPARGKCYKKHSMHLLRKTRRIIMKEYNSKSSRWKKFNTGRKQKKQWRSC